MFDPIFGQIRGLFCPASKSVNNLETVPRSNVPNLLFYLLHAVSPGIRKDFIIPELFVKPFRRSPSSFYSPHLPITRSFFSPHLPITLSPCLSFHPITLSPFPPIYFFDQPKIDVPSLHIHPIQPHPDFIADSERLVSPLTHKTVFFFMILVIIVVKAGHPY